MTKDDGVATTTHEEQLTEAEKYKQARTQVKKRQYERQITKEPSKKESNRR